MIMYSTRRDVYEPDVWLYWVEEGMKGRKLTCGCKIFIKMLVLTCHVLI